MLGRVAGASDRETNASRNRAATSDFPLQIRPTSPLRFTALFVGGFLLTIVFYAESSSSSCLQSVAFFVFAIRSAQKAPVNMIMNGGTNRAA